MILTDPYDMGYLLGYEDAFATIATRDSITVIAPVLDYYRAREMLESDVTVLGYASYKMNAPDDIKMIDREELMRMLIGGGNKVIEVDDTRNWLISEVRSKAPNAAIIDVREKILDARSIKTQQELDLMRRAAKITLESLGDVLEEGLHGRRERDVAASIYRHMIEKGGAMELHSNP